MEMNYIMPLALVLWLLFLAATTTTLAGKESYVVYLGAHSHPTTAAADIQQIVTNSHHQLLGSILGGVEKARDSIIYSYTNHINGFAVTLDEEEATQLSKHPDVVSVFPNKRRYLHTTHSWEFLGLEHENKVLPNSLWEKGNYGEDVIVGHLDTGVWPESKSFSDEGLGPAPTRWKGACQNGSDAHGFTCNRKLIGARYFEKGFINGGLGMDPNEYNSPRDSSGHGTHTAATAAGSFVPNASIFGSSNGTAKGGSPRARLAIYKVCWCSADGELYCFDADVLAAFDAAISDGVDVITISLGAAAVPPSGYFSEAIAIGSFHAISRGITVVASAGNDGPTLGSVVNVAPWLFSVAASTLDRDFVSLLSLGNNRTFQGRGLSSGSVANKLYPLATGSDVKAAEADSKAADYCQHGSLDPKKVKGKIIACLSGLGDEGVRQGEVVKEAGGIGMIVCNDESAGNQLGIPEPHVLPATHLTANHSKDVLAYINSTKSPVAFVGHPITKLHTTPSPVIAYSSSRGPNPVNPEILKPDITAPGVQILASYIPVKPPTDYEFDKRHVNFNLLSGTSMACPHVSGIVGLLKNAHPDWSPAAIRSAIMTTATQLNNLKKPIINGVKLVATPFDYGSGHLCPSRALDPGLVYDISVADYFSFLCAIGYNNTNIATVTGKSYSCPPRIPKVTDLNYPSITISNVEGTRTISRTLKNVGKAGTYTAHIQSPPEIKVSVTPRSLKFERVGEEKKFTVTVKARKRSDKGFVFGALVWSDGVHHVRSPISVGIGPS
ncbi:subtilisin-like protease SBT5.3 [Nymphaea colorata]|nr:subtilisin-like protease SBT5.3 [Nymphaea colorata]